MSAFKAVVGQLYERRPEVIAACETVLAELMDTSILDAKLEKARSDAETIAAEVKALVGKDAGDTFKERYAALEKRYITIQKKLQTLEADRDEQLYRARKAKAFLKTMDSTDDLSDEELFIALVDKVVVGEKLTFVLRDGSEW